MRGKLRLLYKKRRFIMQVFIPTGFANIVNSCNAELKQILPFIEKYLGKTISDKFINACKKMIIKLQIK